MNQKRNPHFSSVNGRGEQIRSFGFTLIELMVVLAIIVTITTIVLTNQSSFNKTLVLANTAYDIALTLRSAETYGIGGRAIVGAANVGYGVDFQKGTPGSFTLFADTYPGPSLSSACHPTNDVSAPSAQPGDCVYEASQGERVTDYKLGNNITITDFCAFPVFSRWSCASNGLTSLDIVFARPNPDALMSADGSYSPLSPVTKACITISSPQGGSRFISVAASGQITANAPSCP